MPAPAIVGAKRNLLSETLIITVKMSDIHRANENFGTCLVISVPLAHVFYQLPEIHRANQNLARIEASKISNYFFFVL